MPSKLVVGLMSGSSLDGLDIALCRFHFTTEPEYSLDSWEIVKGTTLSYPKPWQARLRMAIHLPATELWRLHADLGKHFGRELSRWLRQQDLTAELVGSHGHTIFHEPDRGYTVQLGDGAQLAFAVGLPTVSELRSSDIAAGGQGAPIAPLADRWLFPDYLAFLNVGGIANISLKTADGNIVAGDVSGANQILDHYARTLGKDYDDEGQLARSGRLNEDLLTTLQAIEYHSQPYPKSLSNDWVQQELLSVLEAIKLPVEDKLHTFCHFLSNRIHADLTAACTTSGHSPQPIKVLVSGGGAHHRFLMDCLRNQEQDALFPLGYEVADAHQVGDLKEAALVALCALHRELGIPNAIATATGAKRDSCNGALYLP